MFKNNLKKWNFKWGISIITCLATFLVILQDTAMNVTFIKLVSDLNTDILMIQRIITIYSLLMASFMITGSKIQDVIGRKKSFLYGMMIFALGAFLSSFSFNAWMLLITWSILEGIGAALMLPAVTSIISTSYNKTDRIIAFGMWSGISAIGLIIGPMFGGVLTTYLSWRFIFLSEFLITLIIIFFSTVIIPNYKSKMKWDEFDYIGSILSTISLILIVLSFLYLNENIELALLIFIIGSLLFILFILLENKRINKKLDPISDFRLFKNKTFIIGTINSSINQFTIAGLLFIIPIFLQIMKFDPLNTGLFLLPLSLSIVITAFLSTKLTKFLNPKHILTISFLIATTGIYIFSLNLHENMNPWSLVPITIIFGIGTGMSTAPLTNNPISAISVDKNSEGSGLLSTFRNLAYAIGTAIIGFLLISGVVTGLTLDLNQIQHNELDSKSIQSNVKTYFEKMQVNNQNISNSIHESYQDIINKNIIKTMKTIFNALTIITLFGAILNCFTRKIEN
jgi:EmrB/QacA subfamily drug resistance transporter